MVMALFPTAPDKATPRARQSRLARFRHGVCRRAVRALTGAELYLRGGITLLQAALSVGSNHHYVAAGIVLIKSGDVSLIEKVVRGDVSILAAAKMVQGPVQAS